MAILECSGLTKRYGAKTALDGFSVKIEPGKIVGLLGPNGSGKTTLLKLANGLLTPNGGEVLINGEKPGIESKKITSYLPDRNYLPDWMNFDKLADFFEDFYSDFDRTRAEDMISRLDLDRKMSIHQMSKGTKEKVQLILVMSREAELYILDEPIAGVDPAARDFILRTIITNYNENATILLSTHLITDIENILDEVIFMKNGSLLLHTSADAIREKQGKSIDTYFREVYAC